MSEGSIPNSPSTNTALFSPTPRIEIRCSKALLSTSDSSSKPSACHVNAPREVTDVYFDIVRDDARGRLTRLFSVQAVPLQRAGGSSRAPVRR